MEEGFLPPCFSTGRYYLVMSYALVYGYGSSIARQQLEERETLGKTLADITEALSHEYDGPTEVKDGFTYIPWAAAVDKANKIFGIDGWNIEVRDCHLETIADPIEMHPTYQYVATVRVHVHPSDGDSFYRDGVGTNDVQFTHSREYTDRRTGEVVHVAPKALIDTAAKGAASDATTRGLRLFGRALGLGINLDAIEAKHGGSSPTTSSTPAQTSAPTAGEKMISDAQKGLLVKLRVPADTVSGLTMRQASNLIKALKDDKKPLTQALAAVGIKTTVASSAQASSDGFEELDDLFSDN